MQPLSVFLIALFMFAACGKKEAKTEEPLYPQQQSEEAVSESATNDAPSYDPQRGEGKFTNVELGDKLDAAMAGEGEKIASVKCTSCHKMTEEKLVGPGWKGVTQRHKPEWIMNFITNVDDMLSKDPKAQAMLEICLVRMPNQNLTDEDARNVYE